ncbi:MAG: tetratricopeptide repeat protein [Spirochaetales bacterium]|nr:tetratricopeptide repeat protein [Spirochaetales bacterium]
MNKKKWTSLILFTLIFSFLYGGSSFDDGVEAYRYSRFSEAESYLLAAKSEEPARDEIYVLLGTVYRNLNRNDEAEAVFKEGMALYGVNREILAYHLANLYYTLNRKEEALSYYTQIVQGSSEYKAGATLNRANCYLSLGDYPPAVSDYNSYLVLEPLTPQRGEIERMLALLNQKIASEEERIRMAEQQAALEEAKRLESERMAAEEAARQQALLDEILASLEGVGEETQVIGAGTENIVIEEEESDIEE